MKFLRKVVLLSVIPALTFGQRGGIRAGGGVHPGGGVQVGVGSVAPGRDAGTRGGGFSGGLARDSHIVGGNVVALDRGGDAFRGNSVFGGGTFVNNRGFENSTRFYSGRFYYPSSYYFPSFYERFGSGSYQYSYGSFNYHPYYYGLQQSHNH